MTAEVDMRTIQRALFTLACLCASTALQAQAIAFITNVKGEVVVDGNVRAAILTELSRGQKLAISKDAQASVMYIASGKEYALRGPGEFHVRDAEMVAANGLPPVVRTTDWRVNGKVLVQVAQTSAASMRMRSVAAPKAPPSARLLFPTFGAVATLQPTFRWAAPESRVAADFTLSVAGQDKPVVQSKTASQAYRVPAKLKPDTDYLWIVAYGGSALGTGKFRTLTAEAAQAAEQRRPTEKSEFSDRLLYALMLQELGATQEAQEAWQRLAQERADLAELAALAK